MKNNDGDKIFEKYICPICQCLLIEPVMLTKCFHIFCMKCIESFIKNKKKQHSDLSCPLCRIKFEKDDYVLAYDLQLEIENSKIKCKCGKDIPVKEYEDHMNNCNPNDKDDNNIVKYNCTLCNEKNFSKDDYVKHIEDKHSNDHGVCAICSNLPWGDKNYVTYLLGHVDLRHKSKKDQRVGMSNDDYDDVIKEVLKKSMTEK